MSLRPFKCEKCGRDYYRKNVLKAHRVKCLGSGRSSVIETPVSGTPAMAGAQSPLKKQAESSSDSSSDDDLGSMIDENL